MAVLPVTVIVRSSAPSRFRFSSAPGVGANRYAETRSTTTRFISSGNGASKRPERSPASTWPTGTPRWNAASAVAIAVVVSPCTSTTSG